MANLSTAKKLAAKLATKAEAEAVTNAPHIMFTTVNPYHPTSGPQLKPFDAAKKLQDMGEDVQVVRGKYGAKEPSILVKNPKNADLIQEMAKAHGQDSVFHSSEGRNFLIQLHDNEKTGLKAGQVITGSGKSMTSELPSDMYTRINTKEGPVAYQGSLNFDAPAQRGVKHYGPEGLSSLDPNKAGKGFDERKLMRSGPDQNKTTQMYNILDPKESGITGQRYIGAVPESEIYSASKDPKNLISKQMIDKQLEKGAGREADAIKGALKEGGVDVFERPLGGDQKVLESFKSVPVVKGFNQVGQKSVMEEALKAALANQAIGGAARWGAEKITPVLQNPTVHATLDALNKPQQWATQGLDKVTGGEGNVSSFADIASRLQSKLPASMQGQITPGLARDVGYAADLAFPAPKIDKLAHAVMPVAGVVGKAEKALAAEKAAEKASKIAEDMSPEVKAALAKLKERGEAPSAAVATIYKKATGETIPVVTGRAADDFGKVYTPDMPKKIAEKLKDKAK